MVDRQKTGPDCLKRLKFIWEVFTVSVWPDRVSFCPKSLFGTLFFYYFYFFCPSANLCKKNTLIKIVFLTGSCHFSNDYLKRKLRLTLHFWVMYIQIFMNKKQTKKCSLKKVVFWKNQQLAGPIASCRAPFYCISLQIDPRTPYFLHPSWPKTVLFDSFDIAFCCISNIRLVVWGSGT